MFSALEYTSHSVPHMKCTSTVEFADIMHVSATVRPTAISELFCMLFVAQPSGNAFCNV